MPIAFCRFRSALPLLLLLLISTMVFAPLFGHSLIFRDSFYYFAPAKFLIARALRSGTIYKWNPWAFLGVPFAADIQAGWFYPLNVLYLVLPFGWAHRFFILVHYPLAAAGMYFFLRGRGVEKEAGFLGALGFALSGYLVSQHGNVPYLIGPALAPYALYFLERSFRGSGWWMAGSGALMTLQVLGGEPQSAALTGGLVAATGLSAAVSSRGSRPLAAAAGTLLLSLLLAAVQILPALEMMSRSIRSTGLPLEESSLFSFHPLRTLELIWPLPFGALWPNMTFWAHPLTDAPAKISDLPWAPSNYLGLPFLTLAAIGALFVRQKWRWLPAGGAALFFLLALGRFTPLYGFFFRTVPGLYFFRYPEKYMAWFTMCAAMLAALGFQGVMEEMRDRPLRLRLGGAVYLGLTVLIALWIWQGWPAEIQKIGALETGSPKFLRVAESFNLRGLEFLAVNLAAGLLAVLCSAGRFSGRTAFVMLIVALTADWYSANITIIPRGPAELFESPPLAARVITSHSGGGRFRVFRREMEFRDRGGGETGPRFERQCLWEWSTLRWNFQAMADLEELIGENPYPVGMGIQVLRDHLTPQVLELYNTRYILSLSDSPPPGGVEAEVIYRDPVKDLAITHLPSAFPRAYWVPAAVAAKNEDTAAGLLGRVDLRRTVILTTTEKILAGSSGGKLVPAEVLQYQPDEVEISLSAPAPGWLVLSDRFYPGWAAEVDGRRTPIYPANVFVRAVPVQAGKHRVRFFFRPLFFTAGAVVSLTAAAVMALAGAMACCRPRKKAAAGES